MAIQKKLLGPKLLIREAFFHLALFQDILSLKEHKIHMSQKVERDRGAEKKDICIQ